VSPSALACLRDVRSAAADIVSTVASRRRVGRLCGKEKGSILVTASSRPSWAHRVNGPRREGGRGHRRWVAHRWPTVCFL